MCLNHPETIPPPPLSVEKLSSMKPVPGAKNLGDRYSRRPTSAIIEVLMRGRKTVVKETSLVRRLLQQLLALMSTFVLLV